MASCEDCKCELFQLCDAHLLWVDSQENISVREQIKLMNWVLIDIDLTWPLAAHIEYLMPMTSSSAVVCKGHTMDSLYIVIPSSSSHHLMA